MRAAVFFISLGFGAVALAGAGMAQDVSLPDGPARDTVMTACTACHAITEVTKQHRGKEQWTETVDTMIGRGAAVTDEDYPKVVEYLTSHFGPTAAATPAPAGAAPAAHP